MTVHVGDLSTDVSVAPEPSQGSAGPVEGGGWGQQDRTRDLLDRAVVDRARTRAEDFDD